jgi:hypothetical protein
MERKDAQKWMRAHRAEFEDRKTGEIDATGMAEACASAFGEDDEGGPLDDPDHWIWELAAELSS